MIYNQPTTKSKREIIQWLNSQRQRDIIEAVGSIIVGIGIAVLTIMYFSIL